jgi:hypothetical protein
MICHVRRLGASAGRFKCLARAWSSARAASVPYRGLWRARYSRAQSWMSTTSVRRLARDFAHSVAAASCHSVAGFLLRHIARDRRGRACDRESRRAGAQRHPPFLAIEDCIGKDRFGCRWPSFARQIRAVQHRKSACPSGRGRLLAPRFFAQLVSLQSFAARRPSLERKRPTRFVSGEFLHFSNFIAQGFGQLAQVENCVFQLLLVFRLVFDSRG